MTARGEVQFLVFDVESAADGELVSRVKYPGENLTPQQAVRKFRDELLAESEGQRDFIPYTFQLPVAIVIGKISPTYELLDLISLDEPHHRSPMMTQLFWMGWEHYKHPTWITFNGRTFDLPLLELAAFRYGLSLPNWFAPKTKSFDQPRNRFNGRYHLDLLDILTNSGASRFAGGLNLAAELIGKPGKMTTEGDMIQDMFEEGKLREISDYCRCDVLDTYFVFLRCAVLRGELHPDAERVLTAQAYAWLETQQDQFPIYQQYLAACRQPSAGEPNVAPGQCEGR